MNNMFPPINTHSRPPSEDLHGVSSGGVADIRSASKHQQIRRQQHTLDQQRRSPLRSNSLLTTTTSKTRYTVKAAAVAVPMSSSGQFKADKSELDTPKRKLHKNNNSSSSSSRSSSFLTHLSMIYFLFSKTN
jgi:hypothetical protein